MAFELDENDNIVEKMEPAYAAPEALPPQGGGVPVGGVQMPVGSPNYGMMNPGAMRPEDMAAARLIDEYDRGVITRYDPGQRQRDASWVPKQRTGAIEDTGREAREHLAARERGIHRDQRDIGYAENEDMRNYARAREVEAQEEVLKKEHRMATIDGEVSYQKREVDQLLAEQRALIDKGISPWEAYGSGSKAQGQMSAALTMAAAGFAGPEYSAQASAMINGIIDRDVRNQMYAIETKGTQTNNAYDRLLDKYGDRDQAEAALRILMQDAAKAELESMILQSADPKTALAAEQAIVEVDKSLLAAHEQFRQRAIGKQTDVYDQGQEFRAGGVTRRNATMSELGGWRGKRATTSSTEAGTVGERQRQMLAGQKAVTAEGQEPKGLKGKQAITKALALRHTSHGKLDRLFKLMGAKGRDPETGLPIGEFDSDIAGKGMLGHPFAGMQAMIGNTKGEEIQDLVVAIGDQMLRNATGAQSNEHEAKTFGGLYGATTWTEDAFEKKIMEASTMLADGTKGLYKTLDEESAAFIRKRSKQESPELYDQAVLGQFEEYER